MIHFIQRLLGASSPRVEQTHQILHSSSLGRDVELDVYISDSKRFFESPTHHLLICNDGQDLKRMNFVEVLNELNAERQLPPLVVVGIYASADRQQEYGVMRQPDYKGRGSRAQQHADFIRTELMPWLYQTCKLTHESTQCAIAGFSLGGLSAFDIAWHYPELFGHVGVFSGALWWRWDTVDPADPDACRIMHDVVYQSESRERINQTFWFQCGTDDEAEDRNGNGIIDAIDDTLDLIKAIKQKEVGEDLIQYLEIEGGKHDVETWKKAMPDFLQWAFTPRSSYYS
ncbi:MAG: esterase family protein [Saprospiraceae bacterium]|nr:esterase family protein [Saprospiraceae bacterium]